MATTSGDVLAFVREQLARDPSLGSAELRDRASRIDQSVSGLSPRQFHAKYALQARRSLKKEARPKTGRASADPDPNPAEALLRDQFEGKLRALEETLNESFREALSADSLSRVSELLRHMDRELYRLKGR